MLKINGKRTLIVRWSGLIICNENHGYTSKFDVVFRERTKKRLTLLKKKTQ